MKKTVVIFVSILMCVGAAVVFALRRHGDSQSKVPLYSIAHDPLPNGTYELGSRSRGLELRAPEADADVLLIKAKTGSMVRVDEGDPGDSGSPKEYQSVKYFKYDAGLRDLKPMQVRDWDDANGPIVDCHAAYTNEDPFLLNSRTDLLRYKDHVVRAAGKIVLNIAASPVNGLVAVFSADGPRSGMSIPFLTAAPAKGRRYHQFFHKSDGATRGEPIKLPLTERNDSLGPCWSSDGKFVVYPTVRCDGVCVIAVPPEFTSEP